MAYESETYEVILARMLARVPDTIDKAEGSIIYDALAPCAAELAQSYIELDTYLNQTFANTATGNNLENRTSEFGVDRIAATKAIRRGIFEGVQPAIGDRFGLNDLTYIVTDISGGLSDTELECETAGTVGNTDTGTLLPIEDIVGLTSAELTDIIINGEDEETDAELYLRFNETVNNPIYAGNANHYILWANEVAGVGDAQVIPVWAGANTVKVVIIDSDKTGATAGLVTNVQDYIDPNQTGDGAGEAPIGAIVTVVSATEIDIDVVAILTIDGGTDLPTVTALFNISLTAYLKSIAFSDDTTVRYSQIGGLILDVAGIIDYTGLTVNTGTANITIATDEVAVLGTTTFS